MPEILLTRLNNFDKCVVFPLVNAFSKAAHQFVLCSPANVSAPRRHFTALHLGVWQLATG